jgi:hypothetical protein
MLVRGISSITAVECIAQPRPSGGERREREECMSGEGSRPTIWVRAIADERFRAALVEDPLRALAAFPDVAVSAEQVRQLDAISREEREELLTRLLREAHRRGGQARFGDVGVDGRLGGGT